MTNYDKIRERLRHLSENKAYSTSEFAKKAGIEPSNMLKMLKGQQTITAKTLKKISVAYGISEEWLRTGKGKTENQFKDKNKMEIKIKKLRKDAVMPRKAHATDAGFDLTAVSRVFDCEGNVTYGTGLAFDIPEGYVGLVFPRSSNAKKDLILSNSVGVIDSGYRGEISLKFKPSSVIEKPDLAYIPESIAKYEIGDRIGQIIIMPYPEIEFVEVDELGESERGTGGYGSTGK